MATGKALGEHEVWLLTGSQELYGDEALRRVDGHALEIARSLDGDASIPVRVEHRPVVKSAESIRQVCLEANASASCVGVVAWMHTFSPAKMWIAGLRSLEKPLLHLHTQFNRDLPWAEIDMDFMNLNQSAHGDREFGHMATRMGLRRKTVVGHWSDPAVVARIATWARAACGWNEARTLSVARLGDNMRFVAVTEGDKVEAELRPDGDRHGSLRDAARIEAGLRSFLEAGGFMAFTDTFEDLGALPQLPGIAVQRLLADGYGFGAEGDWKTAALVRIAKVMSAGLEGGASFMEDYTYHLAPDGPAVLGAHMLEVCPSIASGKPSCEIHPLAIGGRDDPVRLVFTAAPGSAVVAGLLDLGDRFRLVVNEVDVVEPDEELPRLPVARALWRPRPDLSTAAEAWLVAGGPHHTAFCRALGPEAFADLAEMAGLELLVIDAETQMASFAKEVRWNQAYFRSARET